AEPVRLVRRAERVPGARRDGDARLRAFPGEPVGQHHGAQRVRPAGPGVPVRALRGGAPRAPGAGGAGGAAGGQPADGAATLLPMTVAHEASVNVVAPRYAY